jgi:phosphohistidine phosphatase
MTKNLILLRHLKSDWGDPGLDDRDRPLAERGIAAGVLVSTALALRCPTPEVVLCSPARRTRDTLAAVGGAFPRADVAFEDSLYAASLDTLRGLAIGLPDGAETVLFIGHHPGLLEFSWFLARPEEISAQPIFAKFPTGGVAAFALPIDDWSDLAGGNGRLLAAFTPKGLARDRR